MAPPFPDRVTSFTGLFFFSGLGNALFCRKKATKNMILKLNPIFPFLSYLRILVVRGMLFPEIGISCIPHWHALSVVF
jgi:hypothetical protein